MIGPPHNGIESFFEATRRERLAGIAVGRACPSRSGQGNARLSWSGIRAPGHPPHKQRRGAIGDFVAFANFPRGTPRGNQRRSWRGSVSARGSLEFHRSGQGLHGGATALDPWRKKKGPTAPAARRPGGDFRSPGPAPPVGARQRLGAYPAGHRVRPRDSPSRWREEQGRPYARPRAAPTRAGAGPGARPRSGGSPRTRRRRRPSSA